MARSSAAAAKPSSCPSVFVMHALSGVSRPITRGGMALAMRSPTMYAFPNTLAASRTAARALMVEKVTTCATRSLPYFSAA